MVTNQNANTKPSESSSMVLDAPCGYRETPLAIRRMAAKAIAQHSFREPYMRYMGVTRDRGWGTTWTVEGFLREMAGAFIVAGS